MRAVVDRDVRLTVGGGRGGRGRSRGTALALSALAIAGAAGCGNRAGDVTEKQSALTVPVPPISQFAVLASRNTSFGDRTRVTAGSVGVAAGAANTLTAGFDSQISVGRILLSPRVVLRDRAATGEIGTNSFNPGAGNVTGPVSAYEAPPAQPTPGPITPGTTAFTVPLNATRTLAPGAYGAVLVNNNGTLNLTGGLYQFQSLQVHVEARVIAVGSTTVRVSGNVTGLDRSRFLPAGAGNAAGFRLIVGGATNAVTLGNDVQMTALLVARGDVRTGDRYIFNGAIAGRDVIIGHDCRINFAGGAGFQCANNAHCNDNNTCTTDLCGDALCTHPSLPNNTPCNDGNACTRTDRCSNAVCVGSNPVTCVALDQCHTPGVCAPATGICSNPNKPNGTACNDNNACTSPDACSAGVCVGMPLVNCGACPLGDTDGDGVKDCTDKCPRDASKTSPGICGCGVPDTDSDGDGVPNCADGPCSSDPRLQRRGVCGGCGVAFAAAGTRCNDGPCQGSFTCDGAGLCGGVSQCPQPQPTGCKAIPYAGKTYWFCPGPLSWAGARDACRNLQSQLVEIESEAENAFVNLNQNASRAWIGGNDRTAVGTWRWATAASDDGNIFWNGGAAGQSYFARYTNWAAGSPDLSGPMCASMSGASWVAGSCETTAGYVCEPSQDGTIGPPPDPVPPDPACRVLGMPCIELDPFVCTTTEANLFGTMTADQFNQAVDACTNACAQFGDSSPECAAACQSPVNAPPPGSICPPFREDSLVACALKAARTPVQHCSSNAECQPGEMCGVFTNCAFAGQLNCPSLGAGDPNDPNPNDGTRVCGTPADGCPTNDPAVFPGPCNETDLCDIQHDQDIDGFRDDSILTPETFVAQDVFPMPDAPSVTDPYPDLGNPCPGVTCNFAPDSPAHPWCVLGVQDALTARPAQTPAKAGRAGGNKINFNFDPRLTLERNMSLGPLGVPSNLHAKAEAGLSAVVFIDASIREATVPIIDANAAIKATRCGVNSQDTRLIVLGMDFLPLVARASGSSPFPFPLAEPAQAAQESCERAFTNFVNAGDRAKKALRDAVELLRQYHLLAGNADATDNLSTAICQQIAARPPRGFPAGNCGSETPEATINRFIEYYRRSVVGFAGADGAVGLAEAAAALATSAFGVSSDIVLYSFHKNEEITIFQTNFLVGPIPVSLELLATLDYGATINGRIDFNPGDIITNVLTQTSPDPAQPLAAIKVSGVPEAGAGMALFAGIGFSVNGFTAKIGIEGAVNLGDVFIDAHAGSGIGLGTEIDTRGPPADFTDLGTGNNLIPSKRLVADLQYSAGLGVGVRDMLSGEIRAKLKIKIAFFSKSWRKRLLRFSGFCPRPDPPDERKVLGGACDVTLVSAAGTTEAAGGAYPWGAVRTEMPFPELKTLTVPAPAGGSPVATDRVQQFFYDTLCTCINNDIPSETRVCFRNDDCCPAKPVCFANPATGQPATCIVCQGHAQPCRAENGDSDCCPGQTCVPRDLTQPNVRVCSGPLDCESPCLRDEECMHDLTCVNGECFAPGIRCTPA